MKPDNVFWNSSLKKNLQNLQTEGQGLSDAEAQQRLKVAGNNTLRPRSRHLFRQLADRIFNPLTLILILASAVSAFSGETTSFFIIIVVIFFSILLDFLQQHRAENAAEKLRASVTLKSTVLREGSLREISASDIVPGDIVSLSAGDVVPADGIVLEEKDLFINQSLLTGESYPVEKKIHSEELDVDMTSACTALFSGTSVISGFGKMLVCRTGSLTVLGEMNENLQQTPPPTAFDLGVKSFGYLIMRLTVILVLFVLLVNVYFHRPLLESFLFAIALAVGLTPELLPMIMTVTLSRGAIRMSKKNVIVKRLPSIQNLGGMDILCSDKTGTLTEGKIVLERHVNARGVESENVLRLAYFNSFFESGYKGAIDQAILSHGEIDISGWRKIDEVPFDFERRRVTVLVEHDGRRFLVVKGAPEEVLRLSNRWGDDLDGELSLFDLDQRSQVEEVLKDLETQGFRGIGVAWKEVKPSCEHAHTSDETELVFAGIAAFHDPPKANIKFVLKSLKEFNIDLKVVTGDSELVARHLFLTLQEPIHGVLTGAEIEKMDDLALSGRVMEVNLFCRVNPSQKNRIIQAFKSRGHTVGYLGDGANDAPSLRTADVGISVESAVDVAKEASDIILLKQDLKVLLSGILEGRRTHLNIMKYIMMATSSNFGNMFSMAGAALLLPFLPMLPLQILLNNFLYDVSEVAIPFDKVDLRSLRRPTQWDMRFVQRYMWVIGLLSSMFDFITFYILIRIFGNNVDLFRTGWFVESIATQVLVIFVIRTRSVFWKSRPHGGLIFSSLGVVAIAMMMPFLPFAQDLGFAPLNAEYFALLLLIIVSYLALVEIVKLWFYRQNTSS